MCRNLLLHQAGSHDKTFMHHALAVVVEVNKEERSVLLPCQYSSFIPEDPTVMWTRSDLDPKSVHLRGGGGGDDLRGQNQRYSGRTSLRPDALDSGDFSLTLRKPTMTDSGNYTCSISARGHERRLRDIQLQVKGHDTRLWSLSSDCKQFPVLGAENLKALFPISVLTLGTVK
uniref:Ig-like domain-containing protein n=1 Tax=Amphilophus citrinellus TaxID=61819 RepID=A0A3Q0R2G5_AMPCI